MTGDVSRAIGCTPDANFQMLLDLMKWPDTRAPQVPGQPNVLHRAPFMCTACIYACVEHTRFAAKIGSLVGKMHPALSAKRAGIGAACDSRDQPVFIVTDETFSRDKEAERVGDQFQRCDVAVVHFADMNKPHRIASLYYTVFLNFLISNFINSGGFELVA